MMVTHACVKCRSIHIAILKTEGLKTYLNLLFYLLGDSWPQTPRHDFVTLTQKDIHVSCYLIYFYL